VEATRRIKEALPDTRILVLTTFGTSADVARAVEAGASGAIMKDASTDEQLSAIREVAAGGRVIASEIKRYIPVILSVEPTPEVCGAPEKWSTRIWRKDGAVYLLVVNAQNADSSANLKLSEKFSAASAEFGPAAKLIQGDTLSISLKADEVAMYRIQ
jgi:DNA-binding response OmpR family regulator